MFLEGWIKILGEVFDFFFFPLREFLRAQEGPGGREMGVGTRVEIFDPRNVYIGGVARGRGRALRGDGVRLGRVGAIGHWRVHCG